MRQIVCLALNDLLGDFKKLTKSKCFPHGSMPWLLAIIFGRHIIRSSVRKLAKCRKRLNFHTLEHGNALFGFSHLAVVHESV